MYAKDCESVELKGENILCVFNSLTMADYFFAIKARMGFRRDQYAVKPGLYRVGAPDKTSRVFVTANYKLSFDSIRVYLKDAWLLVLDTKGVNVWCAAGKGTFGTEELVRQIDQVGLNTIVNHRQLILPQLGAVGISAHEVKKQSGFVVTYGPVKAKDVPAFLQAGDKATPEMRRVRFPLLERIKLIPVEFFMSLKYFFVASIAIFGISGLTRSGFMLEKAMQHGVRFLIFLGIAYLAGTVVSPILLPFIPGRAFYKKGLVIGFLGFMMGCFVMQPMVSVALFSYLLISLAVASFLTMNFTGTSTYTSFSGVIKEMKMGVSLQLVFVCIGLGLWLWQMM